MSESPRTVSELIEALQQFPADATVLLYDWNEDWEPPYPLGEKDEEGRDTVRYYPTWNEVVLGDCSDSPWWHRKPIPMQEMECEVEEEEAPHV